MQDNTDRIEAKITERDGLAGRSLDVKVVGCALLAFLIFMFLLTRWLFPEGVALREQGLGTPQASRDSDIRGQSDSGTDQQAAAVVARLISTRRNVQIKGRNEVAWSDARQGVSLVDHDALQTLRNSSATVQFDDESLFRVGPDSLIVFQRSVPDLLTIRQTHSIVMMEGTLGAQFDFSTGNPVNLEVALPNGMARFVAGDSDAELAFNININPDMSSSVSVLAGIAVISIGGHTETVEAEHGITIGLDGTVLEKGLLPGRPGGLRPSASSVYEYRALPPELTFSWNAVPDIDLYRFRLARDPEMNDLVIDERLGQRRFDYAGLQDGTYYWQVSALNGFMEGFAAGPAMLMLVRDDQAPKMQLQQAELLAGRYVAVVRGRTDAGARVFIQGNRVSTSSGSFEAQVPLEPGANLVVVESVDGAGNVAYDSQIITTPVLTYGGGQ